MHFENGELKSDKPRDEITLEKAVEEGGRPYMPGHGLDAGLPNFLKQEELEPQDIMLRGLVRMASRTNNKSQYRFDALQALAMLSRQALTPVAEEPPLTTVAS